MLGLGPNGGSSSSPSSLSASAQPFTVDRPVSKTLSNPLVNFSEPTDAAPFKNVFLHNWVHSQPSASRPDFFSSPNPAVESVAGLPSTGALPSNAYRYSISQPVNSSAPPVPLPPPSSHVLSGIVHLPSMSPGTVAGIDGFSLGQFSDRRKTSLGEAKPYYPPYAAPAIEDNGPLVVLNEPNYDLLSISHSSQLNGSSSLDDYTRSMSGLEYPSNWGGFWNGLADSEQGKKMELDGSLSAKDPSNFAGSSVYRSYMNHGDPTAEGVGKGEEPSVLSNRKYVDILGRDNSVGSLSPDHFNNKSFYEPKANPMVISLDFPRTSFLGSTSVLPETTHPQAPSLEPVTNSWNCRKQQNSVYEKRFGKIDFSVDDPVSKAKSPPAIVIRPPPSNSSSSLGVNTVPLRNMTCTNKGEKFPGHPLSNTEVPHVPVISGVTELYSDTNQVSGRWQRNVSTESSPTKKDELSNNEMGTKDPDNLLKARSELRVPHLNVEDGFTYSPISTEAVDSMDNTSETLDHYNPAVDSPCWKGAVTSRLSAFEVSEALSSHNLMEQLEALDGFDIQGPQNHPLNIEDVMDVSSEKPNENSEYRKNLSGENGLLPSRKRPSVVTHSSREQSSVDTSRTRSYYQKLSSGGSQFSNESSESKRDDSLLNSLKGGENLELSHAMQQSSEEVKFTSERKLLSGVGLEVIKNSTNDASGDGSSLEAFHPTEHTSYSALSGGDAFSMLTKQLLPESAPKIDVPVLINTMLDLSVSLLSQSSDDTFSLKEPEHETLKRVIDNLNACLTRKGQKMPEQDGSHFIGELTGLDKSAGASRPLVKKMKDANVDDQVHCQSDRDHKRLCSVLGNEDEKFSDFVSSGNNEDTVNNNTVQAIKKILDKKLPDEEDTDPRALLYRNLWLEAEAALCSVTYKARFDHMKLEMEKLMAHKTEDLLTSPTDVEKPSSSKVSSVLSTDVEKPSSSKVSSVLSTDVEKPSSSKVSPILSTDVEKPSSSKVSSVLYMVDKFEREVQENPEPDIAIKESPNSIRASNATDVIDRFRILKRRHENSDSLNGKDAGKQSSCKVSYDINSDDNLAPEVEADHSPNISTSTHSADVMARLLILRSRAENSNPVNAESYQPPEELAVEFPGKENPWMFIKDRVENVTLEPDLQVHAANDTKDKFDSYLDNLNCDVVKAFNEHLMDDPVIELPQSNRLQNQLPAGFSVGSSADWEHVLKEELP